MTSTTLSGEDVAGQLLLPGDSGYDDARRVWNAMVDLTPLAAVRRGGGGNFGIVTEFELRLHPVGTRALSVELDFPVDRAAGVLARWRDLNAIAARQATFTATVLGGTLTVGFVWVGDPEAGRRHARAAQPGQTGRRAHRRTGAPPGRRREPAGLRRSDRQGARRCDRVQPAGRTSTR
jgi:FAD/FMN-containing dehydrogenase